MTKPHQDKELNYRISKIEYEVQCQYPINATRGTLLAVTIGTRGSLAFICLSPIHAQSLGSCLEKGCETKMYPDRSQHVLFHATSRYFFPGFFPSPPSISLEPISRELRTYYQNHGPLSFFHQRGVVTCNKKTIMKFRLQVFLVLFCSCITV